MATGLPGTSGLNIAPAAITDEQGAAGLDVWGFLKRRKSFIIVLGALGAGIAYMLFDREAPVYSSEALVQVIQKNIGDGMNFSALDRGLKDAAFEITSPGLISEAFRSELPDINVQANESAGDEAHQNDPAADNGQADEPVVGRPQGSKRSVAELETLRGLSEADAIDKIASMTSVTTGLDKTNIVKIAVKGSKASEIPLIANAIAKAYVDRQMVNYQDARGELIESLLKNRNDLHALLKEKEKEYNEFRQRSGLMSDGGNPHRERQQTFLAKLSALSLEETSLKAELSTLEEALRNGGSREAILLAIGQLTDKLPPAPSANAKPDESAVWKRSVEEKMIPLILEQKDLESKLGKDHPKVTANERRIAFTRELMEKFGKENRQAEVISVETPPDFIAAYLQSLRQQLQALSKEHQEIASQAEVSEEAARSLSNDENEERSRRSEIDRLTRQFEDTSTQLSEMKISAEVGAIKAQILTPARKGWLVYPILSKFLAIGGLLGAMLGTALGYLVELADKSFRKPEDIIREFGLPIIGHIPMISPKQLKSVSTENGLDRTAVCSHMPRSRSAEAYRSVRTAVCFSALGSTHRVIQVTSPAAGDGKSTLALNLSISLAMSGKRTILIESDFRRPKVHKLTGVENKRGVVDVLRGDSELSDAVQSTPVESLFVLPCGSRPKDPSELLSRPEYERLLEVLREKYDYVIIDTPPVLVVTDPASVASRVDGVVLAMRLSRHTRDLARRTLEQLRDVGATVSGIVINGVEESEGYGYGSYRYSDYRYSYKSYHYGYGDYGQAKASYYSDDQGDGSDADILLKSE